MRVSASTRSFFCPALLLFWVLLLLSQAAYATAEEQQLTSEVAALELGMNGYTIGVRLSAEQKRVSVDHPLAGAYEGTYKFSDKDLHIVVSQKDDTVLALYQRQEDADSEQMKRMVSGLMLLYGEPTAMAHDKLVYWAYGKTGKISEDAFNEARGGAGKLEVLATVKLSSEFPIAPEESREPQKGLVYFIISSDRLNEEFLAGK